MTSLFIHPLGDLSLRSFPLQVEISGCSYMKEPCWPPGWGHELWTRISSSSNDRNSQVGTWMPSGRIAAKWVRITSQIHLWEFRNVHGCRSFGVEWGQVCMRRQSCCFTERPLLVSWWTQLTLLDCPAKCAAVKPITANPRPVPAHPQPANEHFRATCIWSSGRVLVIYH